VTLKIVGPLTAAGAAIVSGLALGVDTLAHNAALDTGGLTAAVLGNGTDVDYPARNRMLRRRIRECGLLISEFPPGTRPAKWTFPLRNRIMAALGHAVIVVEAGSRSGALITVEHALELGRTVFAVPGSILSEGSLGVNGLIYEGAIPVVDAEGLVEDFVCATRNDRDSGRVTRAASPGSGLARRAQGGSGVAHNLILQALYRGPSTIDEVSYATGLRAEDIGPGIGFLELLGLVLPAGPGRYVAM
jgi:DNA processing protein